MSAAPWGGHRVPVTLLAGMLGAGKTTLVNRLLADPSVRDVVVLVNDVGAVAVDASLIARRTDDLVELTSGCVCCSIGDSLGDALESLRERPEPPAQVVLECSGIAEPARVAPWADTTGFRLDGIVVAVDAERVASQLRDRWVADTVRAQLAAADLVVWTKTDLVSEAVRERAERAVAAVVGAPAVDARSGPAAWLAVARTGSVPVPAGTPTAAWTVVSIVPGPRSQREVRSVVDALPESVLRVKGFVADPDGTTRLVQGVGARRRVMEHPTSEPAGLVAIATAATDESALRRLLAPLSDGPPSARPLA